MEFVYDNISYFDTLKKEDNREMFVKKNNIIVRTIAYNKHIPIKKIQVYVNIYINHTYFKMDYPEEVMIQMKEIIK